MPAFKDLPLGTEFDFVRPDCHNTTFFDRCVKVSARQYQSLVSLHTFTVGSIYVDVFHVGKVQEKTP